jgi:hypothetical protein
LRKRLRELAERRTSRAAEREQAASNPRGWAARELRVTERRSDRKGQLTL